METDGRDRFVNKLFYNQYPNLMVVDVQTEPEFRASKPRIQFNYADKNYVGGHSYPFPN